MKAVYVKKFGTADKIVVGNLPVPTLKKGEILVQTIATTVNNVDTFVRAGKYPIQAGLPFILGRDMVGKVVKVSNEVTSFKVGDIVWTNSMGYENRQGVAAEYVNVFENRLFQLPQGVDPVQTVASLHATTTAVLLLTDMVETVATESILIQGGGGNVGRKLVETGKILNLNVTTTSAAHDFERLTALGSVCLDYNEPAYQAGYNYVIDTSGKNSLKENISLLGENGKILMITAPMSTQFDAWDFYTHGKQILGFVLSKASADQLQKAAKFMNKQFKKGYYLEDEIERLHFSKIKTIHEELDNNQVRDKRPVFVF